MGYKDTIFSLSNEELHLLKDVTFFKSKRALTDHIAGIFGKLEQNFHDAAFSVKEKFPAAALQKRGKISKGENYLGLPYMVLDHPAIFEKDGIFAFRTMMWWGNPFSITFHVSGKYLEKLHDNFNGNSFSSQHQLMVCINDEQWKHHHEENNYIYFQEFIKTQDNWKAYATQKGFLKACILIPLNEVEQLPVITKNFLFSVMEQIQ